MTIVRAATHRYWIPKYFGVNDGKPIALAKLPMDSAEARISCNRFRAASIAASALLYSFITSTPALADPQADRVEQFALDYLKNGANDPTSSQNVGNAGVDFAVGLLNLGFESLGVPGAAPALNALKALFGANTEAVPPVIDSRLQNLESAVQTLRNRINGLTIDMVKLKNDTRLIRIEPLSRAIQERARTLSEVPEMSAVRKQNLVMGALADANLLLPSAAPTIWEWTNVRVRAGAPDVTSESAQTLNLALPLYIQSLAVLAAAMDATGLRPSQAELAPHLYFLIGSAPEASPLPGLTAIIDRAGERSCSAIAAAQPKGRRPNISMGSQRAWLLQDGADPAEGTCTMPIQCSNPVITVSGTVKFTQWEEPKAACSLVGVDLVGAEEDLLTEVDKASLRVFDLAGTAASSLATAGTMRGTFPTTSHDIDVLYAVNPEGSLLTVRHEITTRPRAASQRPNPYRITTRCTPANSRVAVDCQPDVGHPNVVTHQISRAQLEGGDWSGLTAIIPVDWTNAGLQVYGIQNDGRLSWRNIPNIYGGPSTPPAPIPDAEVARAREWTAVRQVFSTGEGVLYGVAQSGDLIWYRNAAPSDPTSSQWQQRSVGQGWGGFRKLFSTGEGVIYAVKPDGALLWYKHVAYRTGGRSAEAGSWKGPIQVGVGWEKFSQVFAGPNGHIYAVDANGDLLYYKHVGWRDGEAVWDAPVQLSGGWSDYVHVFAAMGDRPESSQGPN